LFGYVNGELQRRTAFLPRIPRIINGNDDDGNGNGETLLAVTRKRILPSAVLWPFSAGSVWKSKPQDTPNNTKNLARQEI
jgi:hypothetical protein